MYSLVKWDPSLDLKEFYTEASRRGFTNNDSHFTMIERIQRERECAIWILYYNDRAVGSVAAHSLDILPNAYRICARTCLFTDRLPLHQLRGLNYTVKQHQNITAQFFIPQCIEWAGADKNLYITSHSSDIGTQRLVHKIYCPALEETGALERACELDYRGHVQTFWKLNVPTFLEQLDSLPRWPLAAKSSIGLTP
jgi:hypothetical protein